MYATELVGDGLSRFKSWVARSTQRAKNRRFIYASVGHYMAFTEVPRIFRESGPGWPAVARPGKPLLDTGRLMRSISYIVDAGDVRIGTMMPAGKAHQLGMTIVAKPGHALAVPLREAFTGSALRTASPRTMAGLFVLKAKSGKVFLVRREDGGLVFYFILLKSVTLKQRKFLKWTKRARDYVLFITRKHFSQPTLSSPPMRGGNFDKGK